MCSRPRYKRRLVCNPCEKHKLHVRRVARGVTKGKSKRRRKPKRAPPAPRMSDGSDDEWTPSASSSAAKCDTNECGLQGVCVSISFNSEVRRVQLPVPVKYELLAGLLSSIFKLALSSTTFELRYNSIQIDSDSTLVEAFRLAGREAGGQCLPVVLVDTRKRRQSLPRAASAYSRAAKRLRQTPPMAATLYSPPASDPPSLAGGAGLDPDHNGGLAGDDQFRELAMPSSPLSGDWFSQEAGRVQLSRLSSGASVCSGASLGGLTSVGASEASLTGASDGGDDGGFFDWSEIDGLVGGLFGGGSEPSLQMQLMQPDDHQPSLQMQLTQPERRAERFNTRAGINMPALRQTVLVPTGAAGPELKAWSGLIARGPVLVHLIRRFGCGICRDACKEMTALMPALKLLGVRMIAIGKGTRGLDKFVAGGYWGADLFVDCTGDTFHAMGCGSSGSPLGLLHPKVVQAIWNASHIGDPSASTGGDQYTLAGTFVFDSFGRALLSQRQRTFADTPSLWEIMQACKTAALVGLDDLPHSGVMPWDIGASRDVHHSLADLPLPHQARMKPGHCSGDCGNCGKQFGMMTWRHQCLRCGEVVCNPCSAQERIVPGLGEAPVRVCNSCIEEENSEDNGVRCEDTECGSDSAYMKLAYSTLAIAT